MQMIDARTLCFNHWPPTIKMHYPRTTSKGSLTLRQFGTFLLPNVSAVSEPQASQENAIIHITHITHINQRRVGSTGYQPWVIYELLNAPIRRLYGPYAFRINCLVSYYGFTDPPGCRSSWAHSRHYGYLLRLHIDCTKPWTRRRGMTRYRPHTDEDWRSTDKTWLHITSYFKCALRVARNWPITMEHPMHACRRWALQGSGVARCVPSSACLADRCRHFRR